MNTLIRLFLVLVLSLFLSPETKAQTGVQSNPTEPRQLSAGLGIITQGSMEPMPLDLLSFKATSTKDGVSLNWTTTNEAALSPYEIERSMDGSNFICIGKIKPIGNSGAVINLYSFDDNNINILKGNKIFYRLKVVENSEGYAYSSTISLNVIGLIKGNFTVYPNPASGNDLFLKWEGITGHPARIVVTDMSGKPRTQAIVSGEQSTDYIRIDISPFASGLYVYLILDGADKLIGSGTFRRM